MESIKDLYKIGMGPSSSHTIGPHKASSMFAAKHPEAASYRVTLYGSLAATGRGHMTDKALMLGLQPKEVDIVWRADIVPEYHTNGMLFEAMDGSGNVTADWMVYSVGGGYLSEGPDGLLLNGVKSDLYGRNKMTDILDFIENEGLSFWEYVQFHEGDDIWDYLRDVWKVMCESVEAGLDMEGRLPGPLRLRSKAKQYYTRGLNMHDQLKAYALVCAYSLAVSEQNARGGIVVTAPTCGSCGVIPGVLYYMKKEYGCSDMDILKALATAGLVGNIIRHNASISGAEVGCQGEIGSACSMAAAAVTQLLGGTPHQIEYAAEMGMEHNLGLTCDPIGGYVLIPCIERNPIAALRAVDVSFYSMVSDGNHLISFDKVIDTMKRTGKDIPSLYKETSGGGLAAIDYDRSKLP
ncbi:MAG: L-serine ammonia-lyase, iron-sulfur-dependent, subunit alpha [Bacteroidaceae bacterium]|nr:L-serine ammonia-lyase, iron-sulfur-dependent, subunit alpha [Bacteroidaceae bacterium]